GRGGLREPYSTLAGLAARAGDAPGRPGTGPLVVAVDLPSGIDADTGVVGGPAVRAGVTGTFGTWKPGLLIDPGAGHAGGGGLVGGGGAGRYGPRAVPARARRGRVPGGGRGGTAPAAARRLRQVPPGSARHRRGQ